MKTLHRYLLRHNLFTMGVCLGAAVGLYLLIDVFDRLDNFIEAGLGLRTMAVYFLVKTPSIVSRILPAVFLISLVVQLGLMRRNRELTAMETSGVPFFRLGIFFGIYALAWCGMQLVFSQILGVAGEAKSRTIWEEKVRKKEVEARELLDVWYKQERILVHMDRVRPYQEEGEGLTVYVMSPGFDAIQTMTRAENFQAGASVWRLTTVNEASPEVFKTRTYDHLDMPIGLDLRSFLIIDPKTNPESLPLWQLRRVLSRLESSGSNVERLLTAYHMKWAYILSPLVMVVIALALASLIANIYLGVTASLVVIFGFYSLFVLGGSMGENGLLTPWLGAWFGNLVVGGAALGRILWILRPEAGVSNLAVAN